MPPDARAIAGVADSKALSPARRRRLAPLIRAEAVACALGAASVREIDRLNILGATTLAMRRAIARLQGRYDALLVDGRPVEGLGLAHTAVVGGDATCYSVACASIVAKVVRDRLMAALAVRHAGYGWERNMGYGTAAHVAALLRMGRTAHHRTLFCASALSRTSGEGRPGPGGGGAP